MVILQNGVRIEAVQGDITRQPDMTAIVNAANAWLRTGGGVAGAIHRAAGPGLEEECLPLAPIEPGQAVITGAHQLPNRFVIHCLGPVYGVDHPAEELLADCYRNALWLTGEHHIDSIAFPAISTGAFGYPFRPAMEVACKTIHDTLPSLKHIRTIRVVLFGTQELEICESIMHGLFREYQ